MPLYRATVGQKNEVTLPKELCERLAIAPGTEVEFFVTIDGEVFMHAISGRAEDWPGLFKTERRVPPVSIREMDEGITDGVIARDERSRRRTADDKPRDDKASAAE